MIPRRFQYLCQRAYERQEHVDWKQALDTVATPQCTKVIEGMVPLSKMEGSLLDALKQVSATQGVQALDVYRQLNFSRQSEEIEKLKNAGQYLCLVAVLYAFLSALVLNMVIPGLLEVLTHFEMLVSPIVSFYLNNGVWCVALVLLLCAYTLFLSILSARMLMFEVSNTSKMWLIILPKALRHHYRNAVALIHYPLKSADPLSTNGSPKDCRFPKPGEVGGHYLSYLEESERLGLSVTREIGQLVELELGQLAAKTTRMVKALIMVSSMSLVGSIMIFLASVYKPLVMMSGGF
ncbi:hypothetical protein [Thaumasiovibrio subtropicus]|uniref:hypothetical protein n=1 Tax=Thaumasiovibrio subtropicus TaxID=1891207 RepID=UPI000B356303|nr:hypothetical protein [Thaumasiovibrio subtropicus]